MARDLPCGRPVHLPAGRCAGATRPTATIGVAGVVSNRTVNLIVARPPIHGFELGFKGWIDAAVQSIAAPLRPGSSGNRILESVPRAVCNGRSRQRKKNDTAHYGDVLAMCAKCRD